MEMDWSLARDLGTKLLLAGGGALLLYWTVSAVRLVISARGINPLIKQFFTKVASGQIDGAYLLTTKTYRQHVNRQQFIRFLAGLKLNKYRNLRSGRPRIQEGQIMLTVKLKSEGGEELPLDFTFVKAEDNWRVERISPSATEPTSDGVHGPAAAAGCRTAAATQPGCHAYYVLDAPELKMPFTTGSTGSCWNWSSNTPSC